MRDTDIKLMQEMEEGYWWHVSRRFILQSILNRYFNSDRHSGKLTTITLRRHSGLVQNRTFRTHPESYDNVAPRLRSGNELWKILDIGCGSGANMQWLRNFGDVTGLDNNQYAIKSAEKYGKVIKGDALQLPPLGNNFNLITVFDVLEHVKDDQVAIKEWGKVLQSNGYLFLSVPAYQWLFGSRDKQLGHYRRYNLHNLIQLVCHENFELIFSSYVFALVFPFFMIQRIFFQKENSSIYPKLPIWLNNFLMRLSNLEANLVKFMRLPFGGSIVILVRKKG
jgi:ubiquinone/menaquinone biosynthesis C-methylase UbiE